MMEIVVIFINVVFFAGICLWNKKKIFPAICQNVFFFCDCAIIHSKQERITEPIIKNGVKTTCNQHLNKSFCGESRGAVFSKRAPLAAGGKEVVDSGKF
jgi:hypothetical protein